MYEQFKTRAVGVGAEVHRFETKRDALDLEIEGLTLPARSPITTPAT